MNAFEGLHAQDYADDANQQKSRSLIPVCEFQPRESGPCVWLAGLKSEGYTRIRNSTALHIPAKGIRYRGSEKGSSVSTLRSRVLLDSEAAQPISTTRGAGQAGPAMTCNSRPSSRSFWSLACLLPPMCSRFDESSSKYQHPFGNFEKTS